MNHSNLSDSGRSVLELVELVRLLLDHKADINARDKEWYGRGWTALHWAVACNLVEVVELLLQYQAQVDVRTEFGWTPLFYCKSVEIARLLIAHGADVNNKNNIGWTPLHFAVRQRWIQGVQLLLQRGADVNAQDGGGKTPFAYIAPFHVAGDEEVAELLVEHIVTEGKNVPTLKRVPRQVCRYMMEQIVKHPKVDLNSRVSANGDTLAFDMIDNLCKKVDVYRPIFMLLIEYGADVNAKHRQSGRTLLHFAAAGSSLIRSRFKDEEFHSEVQLLLEKGPDVNAIDKNGFTPLLYALYYGHWKIVRILVDHGADVNIAHNGTPLSILCKKNQESTVQLLLEAGAQVDGRSEDGATALLVCVGKGFVGCATLLLNRGADIHAANRKGNTPFLDFAGDEGWIWSIV